MQEGEGVPPRVQPAASRTARTSDGSLSHGTPRTTNDVRHWGALVPDHARWVDVTSEQD